MHDSDKYSTGSTSAGVLYFLSGARHGVRLLVSLASLRNHYDGPAAILTTDPDAHKIGKRIASIASLDVRHIPVFPDGQRKRNWSFAFKTEIPQYSPFDKTVYLDCDTLVTGSIRELFEGISDDRIVVTRFCEWITTGRTIARRIRAWQDTHSHLIEDALSFGPAVNTGVFGFSRNSSILATWSETTKKGQHHFIPDEVAMQLLIPHFPHTLLDSRYNCSAKYEANHHPDPRVIHYHGRCHVSKFGLRWIDEFEAIWESNIGDVREWGTTTDYLLKIYLEGKEKVSQ